MPGLLPLLAMLVYWVKVQLGVDVDCEYLGALRCDEDMKWGADCLPPILVLISSRKQGVALSSAKRGLRQSVFNEKCSANGFAPAEAKEVCLERCIATPSTSATVCDQARTKRTQW